MSVTHSEPFLQKFATLVDIFLPNPLLLVTIARLPACLLSIQSFSPQPHPPSNQPASSRFRSFRITILCYRLSFSPLLLQTTRHRTEGRTNERTTMKVSFLFRPHLPHPQSRCGGIEIKARIPLRMSGK